MEGGIGMKYSYDKNEDVYTVLGNGEDDHGHVEIVNGHSVSVFVDSTGGISKLQFIKASEWEGQEVFDFADGKFDRLKALTTLKRFKELVKGIKK
jgi:hypothetical protein